MLFVILGIANLQNKLFLETKNRRTSNLSAPKKAVGILTASVAGLGIMAQLSTREAERDGFEKETLEASYDRCDFSNNERGCKAVRFSRRRVERRLPLSFE
jgi:hypothetical protein